MLYVPNQSYLARFSQLAMPLPDKLLPWLYSIGLAIYILPEDESAAISLMSRVRRIKIQDSPYLENDGRSAHTTAHFRPKEKLIFIPHSTFYREQGENPLLHEVAHAVDFNYYGKNRLLSTRRSVWRALRPNKPLNSYCKDKYEETGLLAEQFACSFVAYFQEPDVHKKTDMYNISTIDDLSAELIQIFKTRIVDIFK